MIFTMRHMYNIKVIKACDDLVRGLIFSVEKKEVSEDVVVEKEVINQAILISTCRESWLVQLRLLSSDLHRSL